MIKRGSINRIFCTFAPDFAIKPEKNKKVVFLMQSFQ